MSRERKYNIPIVLSPTLLESEFMSDLNSEKDAYFSSETIESLREYLAIQGPHDIARPETEYNSVFEAGTPGIMSLADIDREIDLGGWEIKLKDMIVILEVSSLHRIVTSETNLVLML